MFVPLILFHLRCLERLREFVPELPLGVDGVDPADGDAHGRVGEDVVDPVAVAGVERVAVGEQLLDVAETRDLELLRLPLDDLAMEGVDQRGGVEEYRAVRQVHVALEKR